MEPITTQILVQRRDGILLLRAKGQIPGGRVFQLPVAHVVVADKGNGRKAEVAKWLTDNGLAHAAAAPATI